MKKPLPATNVALIACWTELLAQARAGQVSPRDLLSRAEVRLRELRAAGSDERQSNGVFRHGGREERV